MDGVSGATLNQRVISAANEELAVRGIDNFTIEGVAARSGVDADTIRQLWGDRRVLLMDAPLRGAEKIVPIPDTGSVRSDIAIYADAVVAASRNPRARAVFFSLIPPSKDWDPTEVRSDYWDIRFQDLATILRRAAARGELRPDVDPLEAVRLLSTALHHDVFFTDSPIRPEYVTQVLDIFIRGIVREDANRKAFHTFGLLPRIAGRARPGRFIVSSWTWPRRLNRSAFVRLFRTPNVNADGSARARR